MHDGLSMGVIGLLFLRTKKWIPPDSVSCAGKSQGSYKGILRRRNIFENESPVLPWNTSKGSQHFL